MEFSFTFEQAAFLNEEMGTKFCAGENYRLTPEEVSKLNNKCCDIIEDEALSRTQLEPTEREYMAEKLSDIFYFTRKKYGR